MVHRHHHIKFTPLAGMGCAGAHEDCVGRKRADHVQPLGLRCGDGRDNGLQFLAAKQPTLPRMRVQPRHPNTWWLAQRAQQCVVGDTQGLQHIVESDRFNGMAQRHVDADQHGAQLVIG